MKAKIGINLCITALLLCFMACGHDDSSPPPPPPPPAATTSAPQTIPDSPTNDKVAALLQSAGAVPFVSGSETIIDAENVHCQTIIPTRIQFVSCTMESDRGQPLAGLKGNDALSFFNLLSGSVRMNPTVDTPNFDLTSISCNKTASTAESCTFTQPAAPQVAHVAKDGEWGSDTIEMQVTDAGATYILGCASGTISQKIQPDPSGHFHNTGTYTVGGPIRNPPATPNPASYDGTVNNDDMTLTITVRGTSGSVMTTEHHDLHFGTPGSFMRCF